MFINELFSDHSFFAEDVPLATGALKEQRGLMTGM